MGYLRKRFLGCSEVSRRDFLQGLFFGVGAAALAACAPESQPTLSSSDLIQTQPVHAADEQNSNAVTTPTGIPTQTPVATATAAPTATEAPKTDEELYGSLVPTDIQYVEQNILTSSSDDHQWVNIYPFTVDQPEVTEMLFDTIMKEVIRVKIGFRTPDKQLHIVTLIAATQPDEGFLPATFWTCDGSCGVKYGDWDQLAKVLGVGTRIEVDLPLNPIKVPAPAKLAEVPQGKWNNTPAIDQATLFNQDKNHITPAEIKTLAKDGIWPDREITLYNVNPINDGGYLVFVQTQNGAHCEPNFIK